MPDISRSKLSAQSCAWSRTWMSSAVIRRVRPPAARCPPARSPRRARARSGRSASRSSCTASPRCARSRSEARGCSRPSCAIISCVSPSDRYSCSGSPERLANGSTAIRIAPPAAVAPPEQPAAHAADVESRRRDEHRRRQRRASATGQRWAHRASPATPAMPPARCPRCIASSADRAPRRPAGTAATAPSPGTARSWRPAAPARAAGSARGGWLRIAEDTSNPVSPANGRFPAAISYSTTPSAHTSLRASAGFPRNCSGAMYASVPTTGPASVSDACVSVVAASRSSPAQRLRQPEVEHLRPALRRDDDVGALKSRCTSRVLVRVRERVRHLLAQADRLLHRAAAPRRDDRRAPAPPPAPSRCRQSAAQEPAMSCRTSARLRRRRRPCRCGGD